MNVRLRRVSPLALLGMVVLTGLWLADDRTPRAEAQNPTFWQVFSPLTGLRIVTSPTRFHDGCSAVQYADSPDFDNGTCRSATGIGGDFAVDVDANAGNSVWIDLQSADGTTDFRVKAGATGSWVPAPGDCWSGAPGYQKFEIEYSSGYGWYSAGWIVLGHITSSYSPGTVIGSSGGNRIALIVGSVGASTCAHVHMEFYNTYQFAVAHDWDGPSNVTDYYYTPPCVTSGTEYNPQTCNASIDGSWVMGHLGGWAGYFHEMPNPYYNASPDF